MIKLKKNDKLIIIIAVAVVIVAAIGIAAYNPSNDDENNTDAHSGMKSYDVTWQTSSRKITVEDECYAGKSTPYNTEINIDHENIAKVTIKISWDDDSKYFGILSRGEDLLTAEVTYNGITETWDSMGNGSYEFYYIINSMPYDTTIEAENGMQAEEMLEEDYTDDSLMFTIDVSVQTGEKIFRPLKFLRDKGNSFELDISYEYYEAFLTEGYMDETGEDNNNEDNSDYDFFSGISDLINTGFSGRW